MRHRFRRKVFRFFAIVVGLMIAANLIGMVFDGGGPSHDGHGAPNIWSILVLVLIVVFIGRAVRRTAAPIGDVMAAADRVAAGDYGVQVAAPADGEVGRLVESFNAMTARLQANEAQRRNLLADVAHELRTPLSVIRGNVEGMIDGVYPRDDERLGLVLEETAVMARLLDDLRTLSMAEAGALRLHQEPVDAAELVDDLVAAYAPRAAEGRVHLTADVEPLPSLSVDPVRLRQVLENLLSNALRHTPPDGTIRVGARARVGDVLFSVADTGSGIAPEQLPHIFDRFWKSADSGGSGLGLAIAKSLVEAHGGEIRARSVPGRGTTMEFTVPLDPAATIRL